MTREPRIVGRLGLMVRGIVLIVSIAAIVVLVRATGLDADLDHVKAWVDLNVRGQGLWGEMLFLAVAAVATSVGLPRQAFAVAAGYAFGVVLGASLVLIATVIGCMAGFWYARLLGRDVVAHRYPRRIRKVDAFLRENPFLLTLALRLMPVGSNIAVTLIGGVSSVAALPFFAGSALGYVPQTLVFALVGSGVNQGLLGNSVVAVVLFVASASIGLYLYRHYRHGRSFDATIDEALAEDGDAVIGDNGGTPVSSSGP